MNDVYARLRYQFPVYGLDVPVDHGEALYAAVSRQCPQLHELPHFALSPIMGGEAFGDRLHLRPGSRFYACVPSDYVPVLLRLSGSTFKVGDSMVRVGPVSADLIRPAAVVASRIVTFKNATTETDMERKVNEALEEMGVTAEIAILRRRVISIHRRKVVGFGVRLSNLSQEDSIRVQAQPFGGRRRFGCGQFFPC
ncbi:MAG: type I-MYXAN CRISPR-associated protein Cas6/Cmx6 [Alicyclobacillus sp.]|nr:type I-MYXAN CRISPR-associated protein Cas6/Cmx6 [Alicyclobacillus sp.]